MAGASTQLLSRASRSAIADVAAALTAPDVTKIFTDHGFIAWYSSESKLESFLEKARIAGSPRLIAETYLDSVDWTSPAEALAALSAVEDLLWLFEQTGDLEDLYDPLAGDRLRRQLNKDGFRIDRQGRIRPPAQLFLTGSLSSLRDPTLIELVLRRIVHALPDDPMQAIGSAKELVEATSKAVLLQIGRPIPQHADLPELGQKAAEALDFTLRASTPCWKAAQYFAGYSANSSASPTTSPPSVMFTEPVMLLPNSPEV